MSLPRYAKYRDSGVEWLGEVPAHWSVDRFKWSTRSCRNGIWGDDAQQNDDDIPCVRVADFDRQKLRVELKEPTLRSVTSKERVGRVLSRGDLLLEKSGGGELQPVGCVVLYDDSRPAVCSNFVARMELASGMEPSFWRYQHTAAYALRVNSKSIKQTSGIQNLDQQAYLDESAVFPPGPEQAHIAAFLDRETAKIDALVAEQQRLIELLKEKREAVISHAVTKGLKPDAPMKDSGIEWLGEVPAHWATPTLNSRYSTELGKMLDEKRVSGMHLVPYLRNVDVQWDAINLESLPEMDIGAAEYERYTIHPGDILVCEGGEVGRAAIVGPLAGTCGFQKALHRLRPREASCESVRYLFYTFAWAALTGVFQTGGMSTIAHLTGEQLRRYRFPRPPLAEQVAIAAFLDRETAGLRLLTTEAQRAIDLLQERRSALISAAVTGQIDVRPAAERTSA